MKRLIKFRGKRTDTGEWVLGDLIHRESAPKSISSIQIAGYGVHTETVGQFTGLLDKNGKEIYEGDIVSVKMHESDRVGRFFCKTELPEYLNAQLKYNERNCKFEIVFQDNKKGLISCDIGWYHEEFEVVGNIHDNPELLEGGKL